MGSWTRRCAAPARPLALTVLILAGSACAGGSASEYEARRTPVLAVFVYDRSGSVSNDQLALARELTDQQVDALSHGDRIAALQVLEQSLDERVRRWWERVPDREHQDRRVTRDSVTLARFLRDAKDYLTAFSDTTEREVVRATDILGTLHDVADIVHASPEHRPILYLYSDMLQANNVMNMENPRGIPSVEWVEGASAEGKLPRLEGVCVVVVGARSDTDAGLRVKQFWKAYFEATDAILPDENYRYRPVGISDNPCPSLR